MNRVDLKDECLWGNYEIAAEYDEKEVRYKVDSDIEGIENKEGQKPADEFLKLIDAAAMEKMGQHLRSRRIRNRRRTSLGERICQGWQDIPFRRRRRFLALRL